MMFRDTSEPRQPLAKEAVAVLAGVCVGVVDDIGVGVGDGQMAVHPLLLFGVLVDRISARTENDTINLPVKLVLLIEVSVV